jgi:hypothetical protein
VGLAWVLAAARCSVPKAGFLCCGDGKDSESATDGLLCAMRADRTRLAELWMTRLWILGECRHGGLYRLLRRALERLAKL